MEFLMSTLVFTALLAYCTAKIAKYKGYSFGLWWFYGWILCIVALVHVVFIPDKNSSEHQQKLGTPVRFKAISYAGIAAICFLLLGTYNILVIIDWFFDPYLSRPPYDIVISMVFPGLVYLGFAAALVSKKKHAGMLICIILYTIWHAYEAIDFINYRTIMDIIVCILQFMIIAMAARNCQTVKKIWFIPVAILLVRDISYWIEGGISLYYLILDWDRIVVNLVKVTGFASIGLWIKDEISIVTKEPSLLNTTQPTQWPYSISNRSNQSKIDSEEKLKTYKHLLDSGIITREEYNIMRSRLSKRKKF